jgi:hypothetical protein
MAKPLKISNHPELDPTLPKIELKLGKQTYLLCFTFKALAVAQKNLRDIGVQVNLLHALDLSNMDAEKLVPLLYAALITHQPTITPTEVVGLVTFRNLGSIFEKLAEAYGASLAEPSDEDAKSDPDKAE